MAIRPEPTYFGVDYYPEHWPASMMDEDMDRIVAMGANIIRIGEFAWHMMDRSTASSTSPSGTTW